ncbi:hypothetical protein AVEN_85246-1 [Araneus ventricosus]|uniref:Uncharacterized protein n=1 Tax=Araneus ventricosus TaxID=182803 RepID=A0A4Y2RN43_ARAVE|nr:hypothetical protein AVEN_85246-1 [Araneus ventricosus]
MGNDRKSSKTHGAFWGGGIVRSHYDYLVHFQLVQRMNCREQKKKIEFNNDKENAQPWTKCENGIPSSQNGNEIECGKQERKTVNSAFYDKNVE